MIATSASSIIRANAFVRDVEFSLIATSVLALGTLRLLPVHFRNGEALHSLSGRSVEIRADIARPDQKFVHDLLGNRQIGDFFFGLSGESPIDLECFVSKEKDQFTKTSLSSSMDSVLRF